MIAELQGQGNSTTEGLMHPSEALISYQVFGAASNAVFMNFWTHLNVPLSSVKLGINVNEWLLNLC